MPRSEQRRKKQLEKKRARSNEKRVAANRRVSLGIAGQLQGFRSAPVLECWISESAVPGGRQLSRGMGTIRLARKGEGSRVAWCNVLIDAYYMGVKDAMARVTTPGEYHEWTEHMQERIGLRPIDPASAKKLIEDAMEFAGKLGVRPHPDYRHASILFEDIDSSQAVEVFEMGLDGKPLYISGPNAASDLKRIHAGRVAVGEDNLPHIGRMAVAPDGSLNPVLYLSMAPELDVDEVEDDWVEEDEILFEDDTSDN